MFIDSRSDVGAKRKENQDNFWSARLDVDGVEVGIICVCDGMGGLDCGELASRKVASAIRESLLSTFDLNSIPEILNIVSSEIKSIGGKIGTTCTVLICKEGKYSIFHIGDSRCYLLRSGVFSVLTEDHSAVNKYNISKDSNPVLWNKYKSSLTRCIGVNEKAEVDFYEGDYLDGDIFFVCSDGLWHYLEENNIVEEDLNDLSGLIHKCMDFGETDNISICVLKV